MSFVLFSDLHLEAPFGWDGPSLVQASQNALRAVLSNISRLAADVGADAVLCDGDLYEDTLGGVLFRSDPRWVVCFGNLPFPLGRPVVGVPDE